MTAGFRGELEVGEVLQGWGKSVWVCVMRGWEGAFPGGEGVWRMKHGVGASIDMGYMGGRE